MDRSSGLKNRNDLQCRTLLMRSGRCILYLSSRSDGVMKKCLGDPYACDEHRDNRTSRKKDQVNAIVAIATEIYIHVAPHEANNLIGRARSPMANIGYPLLVFFLFFSLLFIITGYNSTMADENGSAAFNAPEIAHPPPPLSTTVR